jgi:hypothetical protein
MPHPASQKHKLLLFSDYLTAFRVYIQCALSANHNMDTSTKPFNSGSNPWSSYMIDIYSGRHGPQPLGTVSFEEIEAKAREKLKDYGGAFAVI